MTIDGLFPEDSVPDPPAALRAFARQAIQQYRATEVPERRTQPRYYRCVDAIAIPVDQHGRVVGEKMSAVTRDLSRGGVAVLLPRMASSNLLALQLGEGETRAVNIAQIVRCRPAGLFFEAAGPFVSMFTDEDLLHLLGPPPNE